MIQRYPLPIFLNNLIFHTKYRVYNIERIGIEAAEFEFSTMDDHCKWAVSADKNGNWVCVGDINRQPHQQVRGGGTVCQENPQMARAFQNLIVEFETCKKIPKASSWSNRMSDY